MRSLRLGPDSVATRCLKVPRGGDRLCHPAILYVFPSFHYPYSPPAMGPPAMSPTPPEFESSDAYLALLARLARTEAQVSALSAQVATLSDLVRSAIPARTTSTLPAPSPPKRPLFSPFDSDPPLTAASAFSAQPSSHRSATPKTPAGAPPAQQADPSISALTQQITALSTSVAQLQRLQHTQTQQQSLTRQPSSSIAPPLHPQQPQQQQQQPAQQLGSSSLGGDRHPGPLSIGVPRLPSGGIDSFLGNNGPLTMPNSQPGGASGANASSMPFGRAPSPNPNRPGMNRSFSSSVVQADGRGAHGHGHGHSHNGSHGHAHLSPGHLSLGAHGHQHQLGHGHGLHSHGPSALGRDWPSPGGQQQVQSGQKDGLTTPGGAAAPGGGIVVSKWEHLNLKVDLLRSISKYG